MPPDTEQKLLADFVAKRCESAFERLVSLHVDMVYGCAFRRTGDKGTAEEISQNVFTILARKAQRLKAGSGLAGWLHKTTVYESAKALRGESRRKRKMKALAGLARHQHLVESPAEMVLPQIDEAIDQLPDADRALIVLHFYEGRSFREISKSVGKSEAASQKQTSRAVGKLGEILRRKGVVATASGIAAILTIESAKAAPIGIASLLSGNAIAGASSLTVSTLITNTFQTMTYAKTKVALLVTAAAAVPVGMQMNAITELKDELRTFEIREAEFAESSGRLEKLEAQIATLPAEVRNQLSTSTPGRISATTRGNPAAAVSAAYRKGGNGGAADPNKGSGESAPDDLAVDGDPLESVEEMMKDPAMRDLIMKQMEVQLQMQYGDLFDHMELDDDTRAALSSLLLKKQMDFIDVEREDGKIDVDSIADKAADYDADIRKLIGEENYTDFELFEKSATERQQLSSYRAILKEQGLELSFETEQALMGIMYEESNAPENSSLFASNEGDELQPSSEFVLAYQRDVHERIRSRAEKLLTPGQLDAFDKNQASFLKMVETGLEAAGNSGILKTE